MKWSGLLILPLALLAGCGYTMDPPFPRQYKTVAVPIWARGRDVYRQNIEFQVTEAVQKRIEAYTPYRIERKGRADTELTGSLDQIIQRPLSINPDTGLPREMEITFVVSFKWVELATGRVIVQKRNFRVAGTYYPQGPLHEDFFLGSQDVVNKLAERVVECMETPFAPPKEK